jgi:hypothetical protein
MSHRYFKLFHKLAVAAVFVVEGAMALPAAQSPPGDLVGLVLPTRRGVAIAAPAAPPALPDTADRIAPLTLETVIVNEPAGGPRHTIRQTITRTVDRIHVAVTPQSEWLFHRNPHDPRRVAATRVDHTSHALIEYEESELRNALGIRGWADSLTLGFAIERLASLRRSTETRQIGGLNFVRYVSTDGPATEEAWWNIEHLFPSRVVIADRNGSITFRVERIRQRIDAGVLRSPIVRFPKYQTFDLADWLEDQSR